MITARKFIIVVLLGLLSGCTVGPTYRPPAIKTLAQWSPALAGGETTNSGSVAFWWKNFNDPELNSLIERAVTSNLDLKIATARVLQKNGCEVWIPRTQTCCGALHYHSAMEGPARDLAAANCAACVADNEIDCVVTPLFSKRSCSVAPATRS